MQDWLSRLTLGKQVQSNQGQRSPSAAVNDPAHVEMQPVDAAPPTTLEATHEPSSAVQAEAKVCAGRQQSSARAHRATGGAGCHVSRLC